MELSQILYYAITGEKKEYTIVAIGIIIVLVFGAYAYSLSTNTDCGTSAACFAKALAKCSKAQMRFEEAVPLEGKFSYAYSVEGAGRLSGQSCLIAYSFNITPENGQAIKKQGVCKLKNYDNTSIQFDWIGIDEAAKIDGACLKLERTIKSG